MSDILHLKKNWLTTQSSFENPLSPPPPKGTPHRIVWDPSTPLTSPFCLSQLGFFQCSLVKSDCIDCIICCLQPPGTHGETAFSPAVGKSALRRRSFNLEPAGYVRTFGRQCVVLLFIQHDRKKRGEGIGFFLIVPLASFIYVSISCKWYKWVYLGLFLRCVPVQTVMSMVEFFFTMLLIFITCKYAIVIGHMLYYCKY